MGKNKISKWIFLSHMINSKTPAYGNGDSLITKDINNISKGGSCNTSLWNLPNHLGTHIDFPSHFFADGYSLSNYSADYFVFSKIGIIDISPVDSGQIISADDMDLSGLDKNLDLLLIKTGFGDLRTHDVFWKKNPGFDPGLYRVLKSNFPRLRVIGFDSISLSSFANRALGKEAHRIFLGSDSPLLPIEDMDLSRINSNTKIEQIVISPLLVEDADGSPCTVLAKIKKES